MANNTNRTIEVETTRDEDEISLNDKKLGGTEEEERHSWTWGSDPAV
jgi:hypothetical protein